MYNMELIGAHVVNEEGVFIGVIDSISENANGVVVTIEEMDEDEIPVANKPEFELISITDPDGTVHRSNDKPEGEQ